jgi:hypothetical protein
MSQRLPDELDYDRHLDLHGRGNHMWVRRVVLTLLAVPIVLGLAGFLGQEESVDQSEGPAATLSVRSPTALRGGLLWGGTIRVHARSEIKHPRLVLGAAWVDGMQVSSIEPQPVSEAGRGDRVVLTYDKLAAGDDLVVRIQEQVVPTNVGSGDLSVTVDDATDTIARVPRTLTVLP